MGAQIELAVKPTTQNGGQGTSRSAGSNQWTLARRQKFIDVTDS